MTFVVDFSQNLDVVRWGEKHLRISPMRRLKRYLISFSLVVSLILCALWVRELTNEDSGGFDCQSVGYPKFDDRRLKFHARRGEVELVYDQFDQTSPPLTVARASIQWDRSMGCDTVPIIARRRLAMDGIHPSPWNRWGFASDIVRSWPRTWTRTLDSPGFGEGYDPQLKTVSGLEQYIRIVFPLWLPILLGLIGPAVALRRHARRRHRRIHHLCL